jgi:hypothetical protein
VSPELDGGTAGPVCRRCKGPHYMRPECCDGRMPNDPLPVWAGRHGETPTACDHPTVQVVKLQAEVDALRQQLAEAKAVLTHLGYVVNPPDGIKEGDRLLIDEAAQTSTNLRVIPGSEAAKDQSELRLLREALAASEQARAEAAPVTSEEYFAYRDSFIAYVLDEINPARKLAQLDTASNGLAGRLYDLALTWRAMKGPSPARMQPIDDAWKLFEGPSAPASEQPERREGDNL